jgi:MFS family permease
MIATVHALTLLLGPISAGALSLHYGYVPENWRAARNSITRLVLALMLAAIVLYGLYPDCKCGPGNNPSTQRWIALLSAALAAFFVSPDRLRRILVVGSVCAGFLLSLQFHTLVLDDSACLYTGDPGYIENSCRDPSKAVALWHTQLTGLYAIQKL